MKSLPPFKLPQPVTVPTDVQIVPAGVGSGIPEKSPFVTDDKPSSTIKSSSTATTSTSTTTTTTFPPWAPEQIPAENGQEIQQKSNLKRLPPGTEDILPEFQPQGKINRKIVKVGDEEILPDAPQSFVTIKQEKIDQATVAASTSLPSDNESTTTTTATSVDDDMTTTRDLLARFKPKEKPDGAVTNSNLTQREFLKNIPRIKFSDVDREDNRLRQINN